MSENYQEFISEKQQENDRGFKPFSELVDCRRFSFPRSLSITSRILENIDYFAYNYAVVALVGAISYLWNHLMFAIAFGPSVLFWTLLYRKCMRKASGKAVTASYNTKMTIMLAANIALIYAFYNNEPLECAGCMLLPILFHAVLMESMQNWKLTQDQISQLQQKQQTDEEKSRQSDSTSETRGGSTASSDPRIIPKVNPSYKQQLYGAQTDEAAQQNMAKPQNTFEECSYVQQQ